MDLVQGMRRKDFLLRTRDTQAMPYVAFGLLARQRLQVIASGDALRELAQLRAVQQFAQLRLPDQDDLQQLLRGRFQIREQSHLLQYIDGQVLRLIDQHDDASALRVGVEQPPIERVDHLLDTVVIGFWDLQPQLLTDGLQEFDSRYARIQNHGDVGVMRNPGQERAHHCGLAGTYLAGELNEAAGFVDAVEQMRECLRVALAQVEIARIRCNGEGLFAETEEAGIHGCPKIIPT